MSTAAPAPVASTSQPAQIPALDAPHAGQEKKAKEKKAKKAEEDAKGNVEPTVAPVAVQA